MPMSSDKWFSMRTDFFGRDAYDLGMLRLSPGAVGLYVALVAYAAKYGVTEIHTTAARMSVPKPAPVLRELSEGGFLRPTEDKCYLVCHEGTLWRRGTPLNRRAIPKATRQQVMERDGFACVLCGAVDELSLDHIYPYSLGGTDHVSNLRVLCRSCNSSKGARIDG